MSRANGNSNGNGNGHPDVFRHFAVWTANAVGHKWAFLVAILLILLWGVTGPIFGFSDTWQLVINTATTIVTFLMVFLIQNTQNRDAKAIHLKLDELIRAVKGARNQMVNLEELSDQELKDLQHQFEEVRTTALRRAAEKLDHAADHAHRTADKAHHLAKEAEQTVERAAKKAQEAWAGSPPPGQPVAPANANGRS